MFCSRTLLFLLTIKIANNTPTIVPQQQTDSTIGKLYLILENI